MIFKWHFLIEIILNENLSYMSIMLLVILNLNWQRFICILYIYNFQSITIQTVETITPSAQFILKLNFSAYKRNIIGNRAYFVYNKKVNCKYLTASILVLVNETSSRMRLPVYGFLGRDVVLGAVVMTTSPRYLFPCHHSL